MQRARIVIFTDKISLTLRRVAKIFLAILLSLLILICLTLAFVQTEWGQNWLAKRVTARLSNDLQSRIRIDRVQIQFFNRMNLEGVLIEDRKQDTLLSAGIVQVRITDWFFLKDKAVLHYVGLQDAVVHFNRTDSVWNYQFLQDYFATPSGNKKNAGIEFDLKTVVFKNVAFRQRDAWIGSDIVARVDALNLDAEALEISEKTIAINTLHLVQPFFQTYTYTGNRPAGPRAIAAKKTNATGLQWNTDDWKITVGTLSIDDGTFRMDRKTITPTLASFDAQHLLFDTIAGTFKNIRLRGDTLQANAALSTRERSGFTVKAFRTDFLLHPQLMEFDNLRLKTPMSEVGNYFSMAYDSLADMSDFIHAVTMNARFTNSTIASDDIAYFAPTIKDWNRNLKIDGRIRGTVDAINGDNVRLQVGRNTSLYGDFSLVGLPDINTTLINVTANDLRTTYADAVTFIPDLRKITTPNLRKLNNITFTGTYTGFINDFVTYGTLQTSLGTLTTDLNMKFPKNGPPVYQGHIVTNSFQLGQFINNPQLGIVAFDGNVKGRNFEWQTLDMDINGTVKRFQFNDYIYQNITAKGKLKNRLFNGDFVIKDPNVDLSLSGLINLSTNVPAFDVTASVNKIDLQAIDFTADPLIVSGDFNLNFTGTTLSDFLGTARISNATLLQNGQPLFLDSLVVRSNYINGVRTLRAQGNELDATVTGYFDLKTLPDAVTLFLNRYYPSYIKPPVRRIENQSFTFDITTGIIEDYIKLIDTRLSGFNNSHITGSLNIDSNALTLEADIPMFAYEQYEFADVRITGDGNLDRLLLTGQVNNAVVSDSLNFPETKFSITARNDTSDIIINTTANQTINQADISAQILTFSDGASIYFNPSSFVLNGKTWTIEQGGELAFRRNTVVQGQLIVKESGQEIRMSTQPSSIGDWNDLHIALQNINIGDFTPFFLKYNRIEGLLNGDIVVEDPQNKLNIYTENIRADQLRIDNDSIGQVQAALAYNNTTGRLIGRGGNLDPAHKLTFDLALDFKDSANLFEDRITVGAENFQVKILERFLGTLFSDMQGYITGNLNILGEGANRRFIGKARLRDASLKVVFTQVFYRIDDTEIEMTRDSIKLGKLTLRDKNRNTATVRGFITHSNFQNMYFDIAADVDDEPMELLATRYSDNQQFYGRATGTGSFVLVGPQSDMYMGINIKASETDSSYITLPPSRNRETGAAASFMVERKYGREMTDEEYRGAATNITYEVNLAANPLVNIEVILDDLTGDIIKGRGVGNLLLRAGSSEPLTIRGRYDIQEGSYLFTFQSFFKKPFVLRKGSNNFIEWTGDPYDARINFDAIYEANQVSFAPLVSSLGLTSTNATNYRGDVNVIATLTGALFRPTFNFKIEFPQNIYSTGMEEASAFALQQAIQQIERNTNELNKQVTYLIVFNSFAPYENTQNTAYNPLNEFAYSTISGLFFGEVNKRLNQLLSKILNNNDFTFNFTGSLYNRNLVNQTSSGFNINQSKFNMSIGKSLLNERLIITLGGTADVPLGSDLSSKIELFPDVTVEFLINKSGTIRATFFYRRMQELVSTTPGVIRGTQRAGANLAYRKDFNSLKALFFGRRKGKLKDSLPIPRVLATDSTGKAEEQ